jgi:hypothetical protein
MKYITQLNLGVGIGYRVVLTSMTTFITSEAGTLVNYTALIVFAVVLYVNMNIGSSSYTGLFPWHASGGARGQGQSEFHCLSHLSYAPGLPTVHFSPHHSWLSNLKVHCCWSWYPRDARHMLPCQRAYSLSKTPSKFYEKN